MKEELIPFIVPLVKKDIMDFLYMSTAIFLMARYGAEYTIDIMTRLEASKIYSRN